MPLGLTMWLALTKRRCFSVPLLSWSMANFPEVLLNSHLQPQEKYAPRIFAFSAQVPQWRHMEQIWTQNWSLESSLVQSTSKPLKNHEMSTWRIKGMKCCEPLRFQGCYTVFFPVVRDLLLFRICLISGSLIFFLLTFTNLFTE